MIEVKKMLMILILSPARAFMLPLCLLMLVLPGLHPEGQAEGPPNLCQCWQAVAMRIFNFAARAATAAVAAVPFVTVVATTISVAHT